MADNITLNTGSGGSVLKTDDDGTAHWQEVKIAFGADNTQTRVDASNPLPVDLRTDNLAGNLDVAITAATATVTTTSAAIATEGSALGSGVLIQGDDGTDRTNVLVDTAGHLQVDVLTAPSTAVTNAGTFATQATQAGTWNITNVSGTVSLPTGAATAANQSTGNGHLSTLAGAVSGTEVQADIVAALPAGANLVGDVGLSGARTSGGTSIYRSIDLDESEEEVKATAGQVYWIHAMNLASSARYLKVYNATAATVVVGTTTPVLTFPLATQGDTNGAGFTLAIPNGIAFGTAITIAATTGIADADTGAPGANEVVVNLGYA